MMYFTGVRRQARSVVATALAGAATVLSAAAGIAETVAQELRLSLPKDDGQRSGDAGAPTPEPSPRPDLSSVTGHGYAGLTETEVANGEGTAVPPDADVRVRVLDEEEVARIHPSTPEPVIDEGLDEDLQVIEEVPVAQEAEPAPSSGEPEPWVEDVAEAVAGGTVREALAKLPELTDTQLRALERYERDHRARVTLLRALDAELNSRD